MANEVFISYTREKDLYNHIVTEFHKLLEKELRIRTNSTVTIFFDNASLRPGDMFENQIKSVLKGAKVLIVLLSPMWINSDWCRKEYVTFTDKKKKKSILPILWVETSEQDIMKGAKKAPESKKILKEIQKIQYADWRDLNYVTSGDKLVKEVGKLADNIKTLLNQ